MLLGVKNGIAEDEFMVLIGDWRNDNTRGAFETRLVVQGPCAEEACPSKTL